MLLQATGVSYLHGHLHQKSSEGVGNFANWFSLFVFSVHHVN